MSVACFALEEQFIYASNESGRTFSLKGSFTGKLNHCQQQTRHSPCKLLTWQRIESYVPCILLYDWQSDFGWSLEMYFLSIVNDINKYWLCVVVVNAIINSNAIEIHLSLTKMWNVCKTTVNSSNQQLHLLLDFYLV